MTFAAAYRTMCGMDEYDACRDSPLFCDRCQAELKPGQGDFYLVRIEAIADPTPPMFSQEDLRRDARAEIQSLLGQLEDLSEREAMDQVYRRLLLYLCGPCYREWIEKPTG